MTADAGMSFSTPLSEEHPANNNIKHAAILICVSLCWSQFFPVPATGSTDSDKTA